MESKKKQVEFRVLRKNRSGHRFILEPKERIKFRGRCKYNKLGDLCEKGCKSYTSSNRGGRVVDSVVIGCAADVRCPRVLAWDKRHGLEKPYTMVENQYPDMKPTTFTWHPATESPGKRLVVIAFRVKGHENDYMLMQVVRFLSPDVIPATCEFHTDDGAKELAVAWAYYDEITRGIAEWMISRAEHAAWAWWPDKE